MIGLGGTDCGLADIPSDHCAGAAEAARTEYRLRNPVPHESLQLGCHTPVNHTLQWHCTK